MWAVGVNQVASCLLGAYPIGPTERVVRPQQREAGGSNVFLGLHNGNAANWKPVHHSCQREYRWEIPSG